MASSWEDAGGFPDSVINTFSNAASTYLRELEPLIGLPEHRVPLKGGSRPSQTDLFVLARTAGDELVSIAVEGKAREPFGPHVGTWLKDASSGKHERLNQICELLGLERSEVNDTRYQLLHRTASAVLEATRFSAPIAVMIVHAFGNPGDSRADFDSFAALMDADVSAHPVARARRCSTTDLHIGWVSG